MTERITEHMSRCLHWMLRFRHRCGYGIHSPFAFGFVTGVVYERGTYYAYDALDKCYDAFEKHYAKKAHRPSLRRKDYRLLFRLVNFQRPEMCVVSGFAADDPIHDFLHAGSHHTQYLATIDGRSDSVPALDMAVVDSRNRAMVKRALQLLRPGGMLVVAGLKDRHVRCEWKNLLEAPQAQVSFDLRDFGIIFYRTELQREHYVINYF